MSPHGRIGSRSPRRILALLAPPLALMGLIFFLSAQPDLNSGLGTLDLIGRKLIHMIEYGLLWWLWLRALGFARPGLAAVIALAYAASDEFHQSFVHGRSASPVDWAIDGAGVAVAWLAWRALARRRRERRLDPAALGGDEHGLGAVDGAELAVDVVEMRADRARGE
jgi:VanZ family protein